MDEKMGCDICGEIPIAYNLDSQHIRNALVKTGIRRWLFCDQCVLVVDAFVNNLQAARPAIMVDNWPIPEDIEDAGKLAGIERQYHVENKDKKTGDWEEPVRKADFDDLETRFLKFRNSTLNNIAEIVHQLNDRK